MDFQFMYKSLVEAVVEEMFFNDPVFKDKFLTPELKAFVENTYYISKNEKKPRKKRETFKYDKKDITTDEDCTIEREYDEIDGKPIYGWDKKTRDCVYDSESGLLIKPPSYRWAGENWKAVLLERHEQQSVHGGDPDLALIDFTGVFPNSTIAQRQIDVDEWVSTTTTC